MLKHCRKSISSKAIARNCDLELAIVTTRNSKDVQLFSIPRQVYVSMIHWRRQFCWIQEALVRSANSLDACQTWNVLYMSQLLIFNPRISTLKSDFINRKVNGEISSNMQRIWKTIYSINWLRSEQTINKDVPIFLTSTFLSFRLTRNAVNTYVFTKDMAEGVCNDYKNNYDLPITIYRPSIVSFTEFDPVTGWTWEECKVFIN